jgi:hypothetical protein
LIFRNTNADLTGSNATAILEHALPHTSDTYWNQFEKVSEYNVHLNYFEKLWMAWYAYIGNDVLATGIMSFLMHEFVYFGRSLPWMIIDRIPYFNKYKIQNVCRHIALSTPCDQYADTLSSTKSLLLPNNGNAPSSFC